MSTETYAIIGAGVCAASAAATLRAEGFSGRVVVIGEEDSHPYQRPPLSKTLLNKTISAEAIEVRSRSWYSENMVELIRGSRAVSIDLRERCIHLDKSAPIPFDKVLIATGSSPRGIAGAEGHGVFYLRTVNDALAMAEHIKAGCRVGIVGGGLIGAEVAATAREAGADVVLIEPRSVLMHNSAGALIGRLFSAMHARHGVKLILEDSLADIHVERDDVGIVTKNGVRLTVDVLLICVGIKPNDEIARSANIETRDGIVVDRFFNASHPAVFAAGDVARAFHATFARHIRTESHDSAIKQGIGAAMNMLGRGISNHDVPWGWSDQYGQNLQFAGCRAIADREIVRGDIESGGFTVIYTCQGRICAALSLNRGREMTIARKMIAASALVEEAVLTDDTNDLRKGFLVETKPVMSTGH